MLARTILIASFIFIFTNSSFSQEKSKKELREERRLLKVQQIDSLISTSSYLFVASSATAQGGKTIHLTGSSYTLKVVGDSIMCDLPYYGQAYGSTAYGGDGGMKFSNKAVTFTTEKESKNYEIKATVKGEHDTYKIYMSIDFEGGASLSITSNNRSSISYHGEIVGVNKK